MSLLLNHQLRRRSVRAASAYTAETLESRRLLAAVSWDGGGDGTNWGDPLNWSNDQIPQTADDVTINVAGTPTINLGTSRNVHSLNNAEKLNIHADTNTFITLALEAPSFNSGTLDFDLASGGGYAATLSLSGGVTLTNTGIVRANSPGAGSIGRITGSTDSAFINASGGSVQVVTNAFELSTAKVTQQGTITVSAGAQLNLLSTRLDYLGGSNTGAVVATNSVLNLQSASAASTVVASGGVDTLLAVASANLTLDVRANPNEYALVTVPATMTNAGTILLNQPTAGGYYSQLYLADSVTFTNSGTLRSNAGTSSYGQIGGATTSAFINNGTVNITDRDLSVGVAFTQNGTVTTAGTGRFVLTSAKLIYTGGSNNGEFRVRNSQIDLRAASAASTVISDGNNTLVQNLAPNLTIDVRAENQSAALFIAANATNAGIILFDVQTAGGYQSSINISQGVTLTNSGVIRAPSPLSVSDVRQIGGVDATSKLINTGTLDVVAGDLTAFNLTLEQRGNIAIAAGSTLALSSTTLKYLAGSNADGLIARGSTLDLQAASAASTIYAEGSNTFVGNSSAILTVQLRTSPSYGSSALQVQANATNAGTIVYGPSAVVGYESSIILGSGVTFTNNGTIRVAAGVNAGDPRRIYYNNFANGETFLNNGTVNLVGGNLDVSGLTLEQHGSIVIASGLTMLVTAGALKYVTGSNSLGLTVNNSSINLLGASAASTVRVNGGATLIANSAPNMTLLLAANTSYGGATLSVPQSTTNAGTIAFDAGSVGYTAQIQIADGVTLTNSGTLRSLSASLSPFQFPNSINSNGGPTRGILANTGSIEANAGDLGFTGADLKQQGAIHIASGNHVLVYGAKLSYLSGSSDAGLAVNNSSIDLVAASAASTISVLGPSTFLGNATSLLTISVDTNSQFGGGYLYINGPANNHGTILLTPDNNVGYASQLMVNDGGAFTNAADGIIRIGGSAVAARYISVSTSVTTPGSFNNLGLISMEGNASLNGGGPITNNGTIRVNATGLAYFTPALINHSLVDVVAGTLRFYGDTNVDDGAFLSGGTYHVASGATLGFGTSDFTSPLINTADIEVTGTGVLEFAYLNDNRGRIALLSGANFAVTPQTGNFALEGIIDLSPTSTFAITGNVTLAGPSQPVVRSEIASLTNFGKLAITGTLNLNSPLSTSRFDPDLVGAYDPPLNTTFNVITATGGITNAFDSFQGGLTPSGRIMTLQRPDANTVAVRIDPGPLPAAPQILSQTYDYLTRQAVVFQFNQDVSAFLSRKDYQIVNLTTGQTLPQSAGTLTFNTASNQATLLLTNQLADGNYKLTVNAGDIANAAGVPASGSPIVLQFFVLSGDANHDRVVNFTDLVALAQHYGLSGQNYAQGDFNYSGTVDFADLVILAQHYNQSLAAPPPLVAPLATGTATTGKGRVARDVLA